MNSAGDLPKEGLPHSDIRGSTIARISPRLFAACHVLHRLLAPRHPPNALVSLTIQSPQRPHAVPNRAQTSRCRTASSTLTNYTSIPRFTCQRSSRQGQVHRPGATCGGFGSTRPSRPRGRGTPVGGNHACRGKTATCRRARAPAIGFVTLRGIFTLGAAERKNGGKRIRTDDPLLAKQVLYQLSYAPVVPIRRSRRTDAAAPSTRAPRRADRRLAAPTRDFSSGPAG